MLPTFTLAHLPTQRATASFSPVLATFYPAFGKARSGGPDANTGPDHVPSADGQSSFADQWPVSSDAIDPNCRSCHRNWLA